MEVMKKNNILRNWWIRQPVSTLEKISCSCKSLWYRLKSKFFKTDQPAQAPESAKTCSSKVCLPSKKRHNESGFLDMKKKQNLSHVIPNGLRKGIYFVIISCQTIQWSSSNVEEIFLKIPEEAQESLDWKTDGLFDKDPQKAGMALVERQESFKNHFESISNAVDRLIKTLGSLNLKSGVLFDKKHIKHTQNKAGIGNEKNAFYAKSLQNHVTFVNHNVYFLAGKKMEIQFPYRGKFKTNEASLFKKTAYYQNSEYDNELVYAYHKANIKKKSSKPIKVSAIPFSANGGDGDDPERPRNFKRAEAYCLFWAAIAFLAILIIMLVYCLAVSLMCLLILMQLMERLMSFFNEIFFENDFLSFEGIEIFSLGVTEVMDESDYPEMAIVPIREDDGNPNDLTYSIVMLLVRLLRIN